MNKKTTESINVVGCMSTIMLICHKCDYGFLWMVTGEKPVCPQCEAKSPHADSAILEARKKGAAPCSS